MPTDLNKLPSDLREPAKKIVSHLKIVKEQQHGIGANIAEIVKATGLSRYAVARTLPLLEEKRIVKSQRSGPAKVFTIMEEAV